MLLLMLKVGEPGCGPEAFHSCPQQPPSPSPSPPPAGSGFEAPVCEMDQGPPSSSVSPSRRSGFRVGRRPVSCGNFLVLGTWRTSGQEDHEEGTVLEPEGTGSGPAALMMVLFPCVPCAAGMFTTCIQWDQCPGLSLASSGSGCQNVAAVSSGNVSPGSLLVDLGVLRLCSEGV